MTPEQARPGGDGADKLAGTETSSSVAAGEGVDSDAAQDPVEQVRRTKADAAKEGDAR